MTLQQAYEKLRKEVLSLRKEKAKLKEGSYIDADRLANEKQIRHLEWELKNALREKQRYHDLWRQCVTEGSADLKEELYTLRKQLQEANDIIAKLKAQMDRNHENSSIPSSQKPFHKKIKNSRVKTDRRPGG